MEITQVKLSEIVTNPNQPRQNFDGQALKELADSIKSDGLMTPIAVRKVSRDTMDCYEIVQGERRYRASEIAGLAEIPAFIQELTDEDAFHLSVIENIQVIWHVVSCPIYIGRKKVERRLRRTFFIWRNSGDIPHVKEEVLCKRSCSATSGR